MCILEPLTIESVTSRGPFRNLDSLILLRSLHTLYHTQCHYITPDSIYYIGWYSCYNTPKAILEPPIHYTT